MARKIGLVGTAIATISFMGPIQEAAAFQQKLLDIAGTSNLSGQAAFDYVTRAKAQFQALALAVGQSSDKVASGAGQMIAAGLDPALVDQSIGIIGKSATAANAEFADMAGVATSMLQTLKLPADQLESALAGLVVAGKEGAFELKDMARYFPTLTSQMAKFGVTGREAVTFLGAALQIARKGTSDPAEAANNMKNFLSKILAPETIKKFADVGVDIEAVMRDAVTKGLNPIEAVIQKISKLTGVSGAEVEGLLQKAKDNGLEGADALAQVREQLEKIYGAGKLGSLFGDMQVMDFVLPMLGNLEEYKRIRDQVANADGSVIEKDFLTQMQGLNRQLEVFNEHMAQLRDQLGSAFGEWLPMLNEGIGKARDAFRAFNDETGGLGSTLLSVAGGAVLLAGAIGVLGLVIPAITAGASAIAAVFGAIATAAAAVSAPVLAIAAAVAAVGIAVHKYWEPISGIVSGFASVVGPALASINKAFDEWAASVRAMAGQKLIDLALAIGVDQGSIDAVTAGARNAVDTVLGFFRSLPAQIGPILSDLFTMNDYSDEAEAGFRALGEKIGRALVDTIKSALDTVIEFFRGLPDRIISAIGNIDLSRLITWPGLPSWAGGATPTAANSNAANAGAAIGRMATALPAQGASAQQVAVGGTVDVRVTGPAEVTNVSSDNRAVPVTANTGRVIGRN
ncbi:phage tail tape measure protein [Rhizobium sp. RU35A]|uniref:phage tail tape measure protein n=1 Tax=Rhizobium sp. RU35A TaxID=1907414 RepID=UPI00165F19E4|nr:phage tail tape measure protein [Rhizobium sp. RU35A]